MRLLLFRFRLLVLAAGYFSAMPSHAQLQRVANTTLQMPPSPPVYGYTYSNAFPGLIFTNPICIVSPPGETNRLFILGKNGVITVITNLAAPTETTFMDLTPQVSSQNANSGTAGERGLLGMAFHPGFATNGYFYVLFMPTNSADGGYFDRLARFQVSPLNPNHGDTNSQLVIYDQVDPDPNHNSGDIHFGADGYLYISVGDEGKEHDGFHCAQVITNDLFSGILRIDVDKRPGNLEPNPAPSTLHISSNYLIPADNPFIGISSFDGQSINPNMVRTEFYAVGLRNPWRWNFDFYTNAFGTNVLYCGDVGQDKYEEVDVIQKGDNLGWAYWEGTNVASGSDLPHDTYVATQGTNVRFPIVHYAHGSASDQGNCVIGGVVYRGSNLPQLYGDYVYADYKSGNIWTLIASNYTVPPTSVNGASGPTTPIITDSSLNITAFGTDPRNGDVLFCATKTTGYATSATIDKIIYNNTSSGAPLPPTLADTGAFTNLMSLTSPQDSLEPAPGIVPYDINVPFWSDNAIKSRWVSLPDVSQTIGFSPDSNWSFPTGTVWIKNFNLELTNGDPSSTIRLETRFIVRNADGVYGVTYRWDGSQTNATLVPAEGTNDWFVINDGGIIRTQLWHYPSRAECLDCHTPAGGFGLGFNTPQLNHEYDYGNGSGPTNEILALSHAGYFSSPVTNDVHTLLALATATNTAYSLEFRTRSFLQANCSQCHQPQGTAQQSAWDARITTPTALTGLINGALVNNLGDNNNRVISPADPSHSVLLTRDAIRDGFGGGAIQMPPIDTVLTDTDATNVETQWILSMTNQFWIGASPDPQTVAPGNDAIYTVNFVGTPDFSSDVALSVSGLPANTSTNFSPAIVNNAATNSTLTITTTGSTPEGVYKLTITGIGGGKTNTVTATLTISSIVYADPGTLIWNASSPFDINWSTALNWTNITTAGNGVPGSANDVVFTNIAATSSAGIENNIVDFNPTVASLRYANNAPSSSPNYHVTSINDGQTLTINNGLVIGTADDSGADQVVNAAITGANGTVLLNGGIFSITQGSGSDGAHQATLDLSGLGTFKAVNVSKMGIAVYEFPPDGGNGGQRSCGVLYLAKTNLVSVTSTGVTNGIVVGWNTSQGNGDIYGTPNSADKTSALYLGQTNAIYADAICVGSVKILGALMAFNPNGLNHPTAYFRGVGGDNSRVSFWGIGDTSTKDGSNQSASGTNDFSGGTVDALVGNMTIGVSQTGNYKGNTGNGSGTLTFDAGTIDVNYLTNGWSVGTGTNGTDMGAGTVNVNGTGTLKVNSVLALAMNTGGGGGVPSGRLNLTGGVLLANKIIAGSGLSMIVANNGTLVLTNNAGSPGSAISTLALNNSILHLNLNAAAVTTNLVVTNLVASGNNAISIDSAANVSGPVTFPLISYSSFTGSVAVNFAKGDLPPGFSAGLVDNSAQHRIDLVIAASSKVVPHIGAVASSGNSFIFSGTNGLPKGMYYVLTSTNVATPLNQWMPIATNPFDAGGNFNFTNPISTNTQLFYLLQLP